jgi:hypothetical protein
VQHCPPLNPVPPIPTNQDNGLPVGGKKADLWERAEAEMEAVSEHCPVSRGAMARAKQQQVGLAGAHRVARLVAMARGQGRGPWAGPTEPGRGDRFEGSPPARPPPTGPPDA